MLDGFERRPRRRGAVLLSGVALLLVALAGRLVYINCALSARLLEFADKQQSGFSNVPARRGTIFDARGRVLATSRRQPDVFVDPFYVDDVEALAGKLGARLNLPAEEIAQRIRARAESRYVPIARRVSETCADALRALREPAVGLLERDVRTYPLGGAAAHVLGFVGSDGHGLEGLELAYDKHLRGTDGRKPAIRDARRRALWAADEDERPTVDGGHVILTIDAEIQRITLEALSRTVHEFEAESGVAVVMSPLDGRILAMVNVPTFDPGDPSNVSTAARRNRAVTDPTEPGSTIKPFIACGALDGGHVSAAEEFDCQFGRRRLGRRVVEDVTSHSLLTIEGIVAKSSNVGMTLIVERMGNQALHDILRSFGFGERTGVDGPGESGGIVYPLHRWTSLSPASLSFGYELAVTPLQLACAFCAIVNEGVLLRPRLIWKLVSADGRVVEAYDTPEMVRRVVSSDVARYVATQALVSVVEEGSGHAATSRLYSVLGKTGTAKLPYRDRSGYEPGAYLSTFIGAAPASRPQIAALVMIRRPNPKLGYYGGKVVAPAVGTILESALTYLEVPPDKPTAIAGL